MQFEQVATAFEVVADACHRFRLPKPYPETAVEAIASTEDRFGDLADLCSLTLQSPLRLRRDRLWITSGISQLEFIVDNQTVASLANIETKIANEFYRPMHMAIKAVLTHLG